MSSFKQINFTIRPAKSIQRKMLCEAYGRLTPFGRVSSYSYVGFGSYFFSDFSLIHKTLGIKRLTSIEQEVDEIERIEFNKPFKCIDIRPGRSSDVLPRLVWRNKTIVWLDYDEKLSDEFLTDIRHVCSNAPPGSVLVVTVDADSRRLDEPREALKNIDPDKIPPAFDDSNLAGWELARVFSEIIRNEIGEQINLRGRTLPPRKKLKYKQLFNFHYSDGTKMLTTGGLLYRRSQSDLVDRCDFDELGFVRGGSEPFLIDVPKLTLKEARSLQAELPGNLGRKSSTPVSSTEALQFAAVYRYFPTFVEAEL